MDYHERAGLVPYLDELGFSLVGYGCATCIGNSGPLPPAISAAVNENDLSVVSVLSGNRNFEGRINLDVKMSYLASPPLVWRAPWPAGRGRVRRRSSRPGPGGGAGAGAAWCSATRSSAPAGPDPASHG